MIRGYHPTIRVLLLAEMCNPQQTSVPLVGYNLARALARHPELEVTLATQVRNQSALSVDSLAQHIPIHFIDTEEVARPFHLLARFLRGGTNLAWTIDTAAMWPAYVLFEQRVHERFHRELRENGFDVVHRITPLSPIFPSPLASWTDVPMLIGPINGGLPWPKENRELYRRSREWLTPLRSLYRMMPYYSSTWRHLAGVITASAHTASEIPHWFRGSRFHIPENGVDPQRFPIRSQWTAPQGPFRFITVARLVPLKGLDMVIEAMAASPLLRQCQFVIIGDGPERGRLEALTRHHGLENTVLFRGWCDQAAIAAELGAAQAFVFPSQKEFGGGAVLEAMATALPSIVMNYGGPAELVSEATGIRLPMTSRTEQIPNLLRAMEALASDLARARRLGENAAATVHAHFTWSAKADQIVGCYRHMLGQAGLPAATSCFPAQQRTRSLSDPTRSSRHMLGEADMPVTDLVFSRPGMNALT